MTSIFHIALGNLLSPMVLFFVLGVLAARFESDLEIPQAVGKALSLYLMLSIGFKGGVELAHNGVNGMLFVLMLISVLVSFSLPFLAYVLLRLSTRLDAVNAAAIAAEPVAVKIVEESQQLLANYAGIVYVSDVEVVRDDHF